MLRMTLALFAITLPLSAAICRSQDADELLREAAQTAQRGEHERAIARLSEVIKQNPKSAVAWYQRGREQFRAGHVAESIADFDKYVELEPDAARRLWERGISYYYAGEFEKGAKQFEEYQKFHDQDVENAVWRYLCVARSSGVEKARANLLPITSDPRVPMMQIYALYQGKLKPDDVLAAANDQPPNKELHNQRLFYAHLYIGLWHEAAGNPEETKKHILEAEKHKIGHYMWDVARVHADLFRSKGN